MTLAVSSDRSPIPPPSYQRRFSRALHVDALTLVRRLHLPVLCRVAVHLARRRCPPPLLAGPGGAPRACRDEWIPACAKVGNLRRWVCPSVPPRRNAAASSANPGCRRHTSPL